ncbi:MAG TPA: ABC transporter permease [Streptosporangiaceae bacterium]|nr:ABC transporter permease [Streptosporangiaceae bacterium]
MTEAEHNEAQAQAEQAGSVAVAGQPGAAGDVAERIALASAPEVMANSLGEYTRIWLRRVRSGESGALPVIIGLIIIGAYFQISEHAFLSAGNIANLMTQAGFLITFCMAQTFPLLLGEIDLSLGFNAGIGGTVTLWMVAVHSPFPTWAAIIVGIAVCAAIAAIEGLIIVWLRIPSFVVTLAGLLGLNGVLLWLFNETGSVGLGGVIQNHNGFINALVSENMSPTLGWIVLIAAVVVTGAYMIIRDRRRRAHNLVAPPLSVTLLKIAVMAAVGLVLVLVLNHNRGVGLTVLSGVPWVVPIVLGLFVALNVLLGRSKFGRYVYAIGGNAEAARRAGINLRRIRVIAFALCGVMAGVTGILYASFLGSISNDIQGGQYVLYAVAGAVIGGVSLFGGRGRMVGALLGGFVVAVIYNGVELLGLSAAAQYIWTALVLLAAVTLDALARGSTPT